MAVEENTPMIVSVEAVLLFFMYVINTAKATEKIIREASGDTAPNSTPMAIPVKAPCPKESEKNAMRLDTTMVLSRPNKGVTSKMAKKACFIKVYRAQSKGRSISIRLYNSIIMPALLSYYLPAGQKYLSSAHRRKLPRVYR